MGGFTVFFFNHFCFLVQHTGSVYVILSRIIWSFLGANLHNVYILKRIIIR